MDSDSDDLNQQQDGYLSDEARHLLSIDHDWFEDFRQRVFGENTNGECTFGVFSSN